MNESKEIDVKVKFGLKSFITVVAILLAVLTVVGVLTFAIPQGGTLFIPRTRPKRKSRFINIRMTHL